MSYKNYYSYYSKKKITRYILKKSYIINRINIDIRS